MTLTLMKCLAPSFSMTLLTAIMVGWVMVSVPNASAEAEHPSAQLPGDVAGKSVKGGKFPTFCGIPPRPTNVRSGGAFKQAVVAIRLAGARLDAETSPRTFTLADTDGFARAARAEASPPPPMTPSLDQQTEAFINKARALAHAPGPR
jgi:hypothetical protein